MVRVGISKVMAMRPEIGTLTFSFLFVALWLNVCDNNGLSRIFGLGFQQLPWDLAYIMLILEIDLEINLEKSLNHEMHVNTRRGLLLSASVPQMKDCQISQI